MKKQRNDGRRMNFMDKKNRILCKAIRDFGKKDKNEKESPLSSLLKAK